MPILSIISAAMGIAKLTGADTWLQQKLGKKIGHKAAGKIVEIAQKITGHADPADAMAAIEADPKLAAEIKRQILANEQELLMAVWHDKAQARDMYQSSDHQQADNIARVVMLYNLPVIFGLITANCLVAYFVQEKFIAMALGNVIGGSIVAMWQERQTVLQFFFGSSLGSKLKTQMQFNPVAPADDDTRRGPHD